MTTPTPEIEAVEKVEGASRGLHDHQCGSRDQSTLGATAPLAKVEAAIAWADGEVRRRERGAASATTLHGVVKNQADANHLRTLLASHADRLTEIGHLTVGRMLDAETIGELMEDGAETWRPIAEAQPVLNQCIIVCTSDEPPHVGEATWLREGDGDFDLWWANTSPGDYYADPISQSNAPVVAWRPMPEAPCAERVKALAKGDSRDVTYIGLTDRALAAEARATAQAETITSLTEALAGVQPWAEIGFFLRDERAFAAGDRYTQPEELTIQWDWQQSAPDDYASAALRKDVDRFLANLIEGAHPETLEHPVIAARFALSKALPETGEQSQ